MKTIIISFTFLFLSCASHRGNHEGLKDYRPTLLGPQMDMEALRSHHLERMR